MNLPNKITLMRIVLIPVFIVVLMLGYNYVAATIFVLAALSDAVDGHLARKLNLVTNFGKIMDPLADKLLVFAALLCLIELGGIPSWMVIVILARELTITSLRSIAASEGIVIAAGMSGKIKTVFQMVAIPLLLLQNWPFSYIGIPMDQIMLWAAVIMTIYSGLEYIIKNRKLFSMK
jgi:CDP-diacylglycerol--glycerol-3-phosphate 3-phosphatidyltransferase